MHNTNYREQLNMYKSDQCPVFDTDLLEQDGLQWRSVRHHDLERLIVINVLRNLLPDVVRQLQNLNARVNCVND